jgi:hypothetical protein
VSSLALVCRYPPRGIGPYPITGRQPESSAFAAENDSYPDPLVRSDRG